MTAIGSTTQNISRFFPKGSVRLSAALFSLIYSCNCSASLFIIGGERLPPADPIAQTTVALYVKNQGTDDYSFNCSASIIASEFVLTAAHCLTRRNENKSFVPRNFQDVRISFAVAASTPDHARETELASIKQFVIHPNYSMDGLFLNDIAIIQLSKSIPPGHALAALDILDHLSLLKADAEVTIAGYGDTEYKTVIGYGTLFKVNVPIKQGPDENNDVLLNISRAKGACYGDSGGPAFLNIDGVPTVWGILSYFDSEPLDCSHDVKYLSVAPYLAWLKSITTSLK